jgi:hypothetical protein
MRTTITLGAKASKDAGHILEKAGFTPIPIGERLVNYYHECRLSDQYIIDLTRDMAFAAFKFKICN